MELNRDCSFVGWEHGGRCEQESWSAYEGGALQMDHDI